MIYRYIDIYRQWCIKGGVKGAISSLSFNFGGLSTKGTHQSVKNGSDEEKLLKSLSEGGGNSLCEGGLSFIYLYLRGGR